MILNLKKITLSTALFIMSSFANAVPNFWTSDSNMGITEFNLVNAKNQAISFSCSSGAEGIEQKEPEFSYIGNWAKSSNTLTANAENTHELSLLIDSKSQVYPHPFYWSEFIKKIAKAKKIEVFSHNKPIATFTPNAKSINSTAKYIANDCKYSQWR